MAALLSGLLKQDNSFTVSFGDISKAHCKLGACAKNCEVQQLYCCAAALQSL